MIAGYPAQAAANDEMQTEPCHRLPYNEEAEQGLLGVLLTDNHALERVMDFLLPEHFYGPAHQRIYEAILALTGQGRVACPVTLKQYFERDADLAHIGGAAYLAELVGTFIGAANTYDYARTIHDLYLRREMIRLGHEMAVQASDTDPDRDASQAIEEIETRLYALAGTGQAGHRTATSLGVSLQTVLQTAHNAYVNKGRLTGVTTGLHGLDRKLCGLHRTDLVILAGRPSMGKTALATTIAFNAALRHMQTQGREGAAVGFFSLEMSEEQLATRILSGQTGVRSDAVRRGEVDEEVYGRLAEAVGTLSGMPLHIDDTGALGIEALRTRARRMKRKHGIGLLVVDYLQILRGPNTRKANASFYTEVTEISRGLKAIAKELDIPVLALSQLSRDLEKREDKHPMLSDLRESGAIEQDADVVMFVYREQYYLERAEPVRKPGEGREAFHGRLTSWEDQCADVKHKAEVIIAKQRHGPIGTETLFFDPDLARFDDQAPGTV